jgi:hypothetical protein
VKETKEAGYEAESHKPQGKGANRQQPTAEERDRDNIRRKGREQFPLEKVTGDP